MPDLSTMRKKHAEEPPFLERNNDKLGIHHEHQTTNGEELETAENDGPSPKRIVDERVPPPPSPAWRENDEAFLSALQSGFLNDSVNNSPPRLSPRSMRKTRRSVDFGLEQVREEKAQDAATNEEDASETETADEVGSENDEANGDHVEVGIADSLVPVETESVERTETKKLTKWYCSTDWIDRGAIQFGVRISVVLTLSSLFVLTQPPDQQAYPQGVWVYISALMVSWFPSMAAASVLEKTFQRILGTCIGAGLGVGVGFLSILFPEFTGQAIFLGFSIALLSFLYSFATIQFKTSIFGQYTYASLLCLLTFGISVLPFYTDDHPKWKKGVFRVINVIVGCTIGGIGSLILWPRSTKSILRSKIQTQVKLAGEASMAVLEFAAHTFARSHTERASYVSTAATLSMRRLTNKPNTPSLTENDGDALNLASHEKYNKALAEWKAVQGVYPLAKWDPLLRLRGDVERDAKYREDVALTLARALRIQTTVVILDGLVRNDNSTSKFDDLQLETIVTIGKLIKDMLTPVPYNEAQSDAAADLLLDRLDDVRVFITSEASDVAAAARMHRRLFSGSMGKEDYKRRLSEEDKHMPLLIRSHDNVALLFLELLEHLVVRCLRLYYIWRQVEK